MKAFQRYMVNSLAVVLVSVGALGLSFASLGRSDLLAEPFAALLIFGRTVGSIATMGMLYRWTTARRPRPVPVPVRA